MNRPRILLVDDEPSVLASTAALLRMHGFVVDACTSGAKALEQLERHEFDAVVCDIRMPDVDGAELHARIRARFPGLERRVLFVSGDAGDAEARALLEQTGARCLQKPYAIPELEHAVRELAADRALQALG